jgi:hypothetical protein
MVNAATWKINGNRELSGARSNAFCYIKAVQSRLAIPICFAGRSVSLCHFGVFLFFFLW